MVYKRNNNFIFILICFVLSSCITSKNIQIDKYIKYNRKVTGHYINSPLKWINQAKYTTKSEEIIICDIKEEKMIKSDVLFLFNFESQIKKEIFNPLEFEELTKIEDIKSINIVHFYILDEYKIIISLWIRSNYLSKKNKNYKTILFDYKNNRIVNIDRTVGKQSLNNRHIFYIQEQDTYFMQSINEKELDDKQLLNNSGFTTDICDGINEETVFYSTIDEKNTKDIWDGRNVFVLYNWKRNEIITEINLPNYFHKYLKGNSLNINLSKDKKFLLFGFFPYGYWVYNLENKKIYEICNTKYNWNWGFGKIQVTFCDWSWEGNKILLNIVSNKKRDIDSNGLYEVDLDKIDELNLKKIE